MTLRGGLYAAAAAVLLAAVFVAAGVDFYVSPTGTTSTGPGTGTITNPWSLQTGLSQPSAVHPGDTIWLRGGTYKGSFSSYLNGTPGQPILVKQFPGELATFDGSLYTGGGGFVIDSGSVTYPVVHSGDHRYLQDQSGQPFPILGRAAWAITSLSVSDFQYFIDDTVAKGFNAIELHVINHDPRDNNPPFAGNGALPFTKRLDGATWTGALTYGNINNEAPDFTQTNESFWTQIDSLLSYADSKGVLCFFFPAYVGYQGGPEGWMAEMTANGTTRMSTYGAFLANRYKARGNIVWMLGGDYGTFTAPQLAVEQALLSGMQSVSGQTSTQISGLWDTNSIYTTQTDPTLRAAGTLQGAYSFVGDVNTYCRAGYAASPAMPAFLLEGPYDEEGPDGNNVNPNATQPVRRFQWWGVLSSTGGYFAGNGYIWTFTPGVWTNHLNTQGAQDMARLNAFLRSIAWNHLVPSGLNGMKTIVTSGGSTVAAADYVAAAADPGGALMVAYVPPAHTGTITVDMTVMGGPARARWFNPTTAAYTLINPSIANSGTSAIGISCKTA